MLELKKLELHEYEDFIKMNQEAFQVAAVEEFGEIDEPVIPREDIMQSLEAPDSKAFNIVYDGKVAGGVVVHINPETNHNSLDLLFIDPQQHGNGIGGKVWKRIEEMYPDTVVWETYTPYFETRNIHFYVNKCGFHIVEFYNPHHPESETVDTPGGELFFRFEKRY